jgi:hypothetical protein
MYWRRARWTRPTLPLVHSDVRRPHSSILAISTAVRLLARVSALMLGDDRWVDSAILTIPTPQPLHTRTVITSASQRIVATICATRRTQTQSTQPPRSHTHNCKSYWQTYHRHDCVSRHAASPKLNRVAADVVLSLGTSVTIARARECGRRGSPSLMHSCPHTLAYAAATPQSRRHIHCTPTALQPRHAHCTQQYTRRDDTCATTHDTPSQPLTSPSHSSTPCHQSSGRDGSIATQVSSRDNDRCRRHDTQERDALVATVSQRQ